MGKLASRQGRIPNVAGILVVNEIVRVLSLYTGSEHSPEQVLVRLAPLPLTVQIDNTDQDRPLVQ